MAIVALEAFDFRAEYFFEAFIDLAGMFEGVAIDEQRRRPIQRSTGILVEIRKQRQAARNDRCLAVFIDPLVTGDFLEDFTRWYCYRRR